MGNLANLTIKNNSYEIISSNSLLLESENSSLKFHLESTDNFAFDVVIRFQSTADKNLSIEKEVEGPTTIVYNCINFDNALGSGTIEPINIATVKGHKWFLHFWSYLMGGDNGKSHTRKVEYTIFEQVDS